MNREIKFRAWHNNKMITEIIGSQNGIITGVSSSDVLMQFTGLKDKNGIEIYEGDVVKDNQDGSCGKVVWSMQWMKWNVGAEGYWAEDKQYCSIYIEVIGNIYENPELLEKLK